MVRKGGHIWEEGVTIESADPVLVIYANLACGTMEQGDIIFVPALTPGDTLKGVFAGKVRSVCAEAHRNSRKRITYTFETSMTSNTSASPILGYAASVVSQARPANRFQNELRCRGTVYPVH